MQKLKSSSMGKKSTSQEKKKSTFLIQLGPREIQRMKEVPMLIKEGRFPDVKAEIFRRGFHAAKPLSEINERSLMRILLSKLECGIKNPTNKENAEEMIALSGAILATLVIKQGVLRAEPFETIFNTCKYIGLADKNVDASEISKTLSSLSGTVDTMFLNRLNNSLIKA